MGPIERVYLGSLLKSRLDNTSNPRQIVRSDRSGTCSSYHRCLVLTRVVKKSDFFGKKVNLIVMRRFFYDPAKRSTFFSFPFPQSHRRTMFFLNFLSVIRIRYTHFIICKVSEACLDHFIVKIYSHRTAMTVEGLC